jgi:hypothetical protein
MPSQTENRTEEFLLREGAFHRRSAARREVLGCIACIWAKAEAAGNDPSLYGYQVVKCTGLQSGIVQPILHDLEDYGALSSERETLDPTTTRRPPRRLYGPVDTDWGQQFRETLEPPSSCNFDE